MTVWILGDQLSPEHAALTETDPRAARVLMIESKARASLLRYHQIKLVLVYSAMRHFAFELRNRGWEVDYYRLEEQLTFESALRRHLRAHRPRKIILAEPNSFAEAKAILGLGHACVRRSNSSPPNSSSWRGRISASGLTASPAS